MLDFYCPELKLAIEVDGYSHDSKEAKKYDTERQKIIEIYGVRFYESGMKQFMKISKKHLKRSKLKS